MTVILNLSTVAVMWFGALRVDSGEMPIGNLTAFLQYLMQILFSVLMAALRPRSASCTLPGTDLATEAFNCPAERPPRWP